MGWVHRAGRAAEAASEDAAAEAAEHNQEEEHEDDRAAVWAANIVAAVFGALWVIEVSLTASILVVPLALRRAAVGGWCDGLRVVRSLVRWVEVRVGEPREGGRLWRYTSYSVCTPVSCAMPREQVQRSSCEPA